jgi:DNA-binding GntR family transcriptional regulator
MSRVHIEEAPYQHLREAIASGALSPNERLVEAELAVTLGVPRAAVRIALVRLAQENLVERLPNRGARVRRISDREALELLEARMVLECLAVEHAAHRATADDVAKLRAILLEMEPQIGSDVSRYGILNRNLHDEIARISNHSAVTRLLDDIRSRNTAFRQRPVPVPRDPRERHSQHQAIVEAIAGHDALAAIAAMRRHLSDIPTLLRAKLEEKP